MQTSSASSYPAFEAACKSLVGVGRHLETLSERAWQAQKQEEEKRILQNRIRELELRLESINLATQTDIHVHFDGDQAETRQVLAGLLQDVEDCLDWIKDNSSTRSSV
jgi:hypothetical protein